MIILRETKASDTDDYVRLQKDISLSVFKINDEIHAHTFESLFKESDRLSYTILTENTCDFCGYCAVKNIIAEKPEIEIELLKKHHGKGIGYAALCEMMVSASEQYNISCFIASVEPDNYASQGLMYKLGGVPAGLKKSDFVKESEAEAFENDNMGLLDNGLMQTAKAFCVKPKKLLSHVLVFEIPVALLLKSPCKNTPFKAVHNRKVSIAKRRFYSRNFAEKVLEILKSCDDIDEFREEMMAIVGLQEEEYSR